MTKRISTLTLTGLFLLFGCRDDDGGRGAARDGGARDGGSQSATLDCPGILACVDACTTDVCTNACLASGSDEAVARVTALAVCADGAGCGDDDACIESACGSEVAACGLDTGGPDGGATSDEFPARITGTSRDATPAIGLDSTASIVFVRDDAAGAAAGYPIDELAFYRVESITYHATWITSSVGCTTTGDETEEFTAPPALENHLMIERRTDGNGLHPYHVTTTLSVDHPNGLVTVCPGLPVSTGEFNAEHNLTSGTDPQRTDLATFEGTATVGGVRQFEWSFHATD